MNQNVKTRHQSKSFSLETGEQRDTIDITLWHGEVVGGFVEVIGNDPSENVNLSIKDNGGRIEDPVSILSWKQRSGGSYKESMKPLSIPGSQTIQLEIEADKALTADLNAQIVFLIETPC